MVKGPIVVGTDGSERAERAVDRAGELAKSLGVKLHIVSGYSEDRSLLGAPPASGGSGGPDPRTRAGHYVDRAQQRLAPLGIECETHIWPGEAADALLQLADEQDAQLILVGNRGMAGARRVLGSVPNHVSHHARCDVMIVATSSP